MGEATMEVATTEEAMMEVAMMEVATMEAATTEDQAATDTVKDEIKNKDGEQGYMDWDELGEFEPTREDIRRFLTGRGRLLAAEERLSNELVRKEHHASACYCFFQLTGCISLSNSYSRLTFNPIVG
jgi:hypothetical protein